jgi:ATP-binding cassette, subfamily B, bacterial MsbA
MTRTSTTKVLSATQTVLARFWRGWIAPHRGAILVSAALTALVAAATAGYPQVISWIFDALATRDARVLWLGPVLIIAVTILKGGALYALTVATNRLALKVVTQLQNDAFGRLLQADFARLQGEQTGALVARFINDVNAVREGVLKTANGLLRDALTLIAVVIGMAVVDWQLALVAFVLLPLALYPIVEIGRRMRKVATAAQEQTGALAATLEESLSGARLVKTYGLEAQEAARAGAAFEERRRLTLKIAEGKGRVDPILEVLGGLALAGVVFAAGWRIVQGGASVGDFGAFVTSLLLAAQSTRGLGNLNTVVQEGVAALTRFFALMDERASVQEADGAQPLVVSDGRVRFEGVAFSHPGGASLSDINLEAKRGQTIALVGPSGAGKTTLLNLLPRLQDVSAGAVTIDGQDVRAVTLSSLRAAIALVSQDATLFDASIADNIAMGRPGARHAEIAAAADAAACDFIAGLPGGLDAPVGPKGAQLSGGERQRIALARAILRDAPILILDEPTSALDAESEARVQEALARFAAARTTLVVAHRLATVRAADSILVMKDGRIVEEGSHDALIARGGLYAELAGLQFTG